MFKGFSRFHLVIKAMERKIERDRDREPERERGEREKERTRGGTGRDYGTTVWTVHLRCHGEIRICIARQECSGHCSQAERHHILMKMTRKGGASKSTCICAVCGFAPKVGWKQR